jgi:hypothetical protein
LERLPVVRAREGPPLDFVSGEVGSFAEDVDEVVPAPSGVGDGCPPPWSGRSAAFDGPACTVLFGMAWASSSIRFCSDSSIRLLAPHCGHLGAPTA